ncbi:MAG TPA: PQQ-dependent sugar dehydrogenase [Chthoniobacterales bacterium]
MKRNRQRKLSGLVIGCAAGLAGLLKAHAQTIPSLEAVKVATGLSSAVFVTAPPGDYNRIFIVRQSGQINVFYLETGTVKTFLDLSSGFNLRSGGEQGLLGMAFDPDYNTPGSSGQGKFYLNFTVNGGTWGQGTTHISQFSVDSADPDNALTTEHLLTMPRPSPSPAVPLTFDHPQSNHNGGWIGFSPRGADDHNLYIATGDGGNGNDVDPDPTPTPPGHIEPGGNAQNKTTLLGKLLRVHVNPANATYSIPADNPFINVSEARSEIFAYGLRNPFRDGFDRANGRLYIGDVGQSTREEVDVQQPTNPGGGEDYGWRDREGTIQNPTFPTPTAAPTPTPSPAWVDPILDYGRGTGGTVIGGYVYRGRQIPGLTGTYVFGDYLAHKIFVLNYNGVTASNFTDISTQLFPTGTGDTQNGLTLSGFGEDANGEIYLTDVGNGNVFKVVPTTPNVVLDNVNKTNGFMLHGFGVPFKDHTVQMVTSITQPFTAQTTIGTVKAGGDGSIQFTDPNPPGPTGFYRVTYP